MTDREKIVDKIKKLFRLSTSPNEHEAALALQRAMEMMEKYSVDPSEVRDEQFHKREIVSGPVYNEYENYITGLIEQFFHVKMVRIVKPKGLSNVLFKRVMGYSWVNKYDVYGKAHHIMVAEFVYGFLMGTFSALWKKNRARLVSSRMKRKRRKLVMMNYFYGVYVGLLCKLMEARKNYHQQYGIVHVADEALNKFVLEQIGVHSIKNKTPRKDAAAREAGYLDGKNIEINKAVTSSGAVKMLN